MKKEYKKLEISFLGYFEDELCNNLDGNTSSWDSNGLGIGEDV